MCPDEEARFLHWCATTGRKDNVWDVLVGGLPSSVADCETGGDVAIEGEKITYVYASSSPPESSSLVSCDKYYYVIGGTRSWRHKSVMSLLSSVPSSIRKRLGLRSSLWKRYKGSGEQGLVMPYHFAMASHDEMVSLWRDFISSNKSDSLNMYGLFPVTPRVIIEAGVRADVKTLILNCNILIDSLSWLFYFRGVTTLVISHSHLGDDDIRGIERFVPNLTALEMQSCSGVSGRCILSVTKIPKLERLMISNVSAVFHPKGSLLQSCVTDSEWDTVEENTSIRDVYIDSTNLTRDFIKPLVEKLEALENFVMNDIILRQLRGHVTSGHGDRCVLFRSSSDPNALFSCMSGMRIFGLLRDRCGPMYSDSMLRKIAELDPSKEDAVKILMSKEK